MWAGPAGEAVVWVGWPRMPMRDGMRAAGRLAVLWGVLGALLAWAWWVSRGGLPQRGSTVRLGSAGVYGVGDVNGLGGVSVGLPSGWELQARSTDAWAGGVLVLASERGGGEDEPAASGRLAGRELTVEVYPQVAVLPPEAFLSRRLGVSEGAERLEIGGMVWSVAGIRYGGMRFEWLAVTVVPSGRALVVRLVGPGGSGASDALLLRGVLGSLRVGEVGPAGAGVGVDAVSLRPVALPTAALADWGVASAAGRERAGASGSSEVTGPRLRQVVLLREAAGSAGPPHSDGSSDNSGSPEGGRRWASAVVAVEVYPVLAREWPGAEVAGEELAEHPTVRTFLTMAGAHDARLLEGSVRAWSAGRLVVVPNGESSAGLLAGEFPVAAMLVRPEGGRLEPLAALLVARGERLAGGGVLRALSRVAERVVFAAHADELDALLQAGSSLAGRLRVPAAGEDQGAVWLLSGLRAEGVAGDGGAGPAVIVRLASDRATAERVAPGPHRIERTAARRLTDDGGEVLTVRIARQVRGLPAVRGGSETGPPVETGPPGYTGPKGEAGSSDWADVLVRGYELQRAGRYEAAADDPELLAVSRFVEGPRLLRGALLADRPAVVLTDWVGWVDLDTEGLFSLVLVQPLPSVEGERRCALHVLGTGRTLLVREVRSPQGVREVVEEPGRLLAGG